MVNLNVNIDDYTNQVLAVIKAKNNLNDKGKALDWFAKEYGEEYAEKEIKEEIIKDMMKSYKEYKRKHPNRRMTMKELDNLCGVE